MLFNRSDIGIGPEKNVLELRLLLVHFFDCFLWTCGIGVDIGGVAVLKWPFLFHNHGDRKNLFLRERERKDKEMLLRERRHRDGV